MVVRTILKWPNEVLAKVSDQVGVIDDDIVHLASDLKDTMRASFGKGLAAPQVGISKSLCVIDYSACKTQLQCDPKLNDVVVMINPTWNSTSETTFIWEEACLSVDDLTAHVTRHDEISLRYIDLCGTTKELVLRGDVAGVVQHETDHLIGKVFIDRLSKRKAYQIKKQFLRQKSAARRARMKLARKDRIEALREESASSDDSSPRVGKQNKKRSKKPKSFGKNKRRKK